MISRRLLVSWVFLLTLGLVIAKVIDDTHLDAATMKEAKVTAKVEKEMVDEMSNLDKIHVNNKLEIEDAVDSIKEECRKEVKEKVKELLKKRKKKGGLRKFYQSLQHGKGNAQSDYKTEAAIKSETCSVCVINKMAKAKVQDALGITKDLTEKQKERIYKREILRKHLQNKPEDAPHKPNCDTSTAFRTIDGTCNNIENPTFGAVGTKFERIIAPDYGDSISTLRLSVDGTELPNARDVSRRVHGSNADRTNPDSAILTHLTMNFGQFMDHDITLAEEQGLNCEPPADSSECINIEIPQNDEIFRDREVDFIELERDAPHEPAGDCDLTPREHINTITAYIDASNIYGSEEGLASSLRNPDGTLKEMKHPAGCPFKNLLPPQTDGFCVSKDPNRPCFITGDVRNNENQGLNSVHTIFVRHHNRIATFFGENTLWDGERIYQETRKIIGAQLQVITYREFLPLLLSKKRIEEFELKLLEGDEFFTGYDKTQNAQMIAGFSVAAYRIGHTMIQELFRRFSQDGFEHKCDQCDANEKTEFLPIPVLDFGNPTYLYDTCQGGIDSIFRGLIKDAAGKVDGKLSSSVQENLMRGDGDLSDLLAINFQRGRERGIPSYTSYRNLPLCGLEPVKEWKDLKEVAGFNPVDVSNLKDVYDNVDDIDLFSGGLLEPRPADGGVAGPTFQCLIAEQFRRLRVGDRCWHGNAPDKELHTNNTAFTACQLRELRKTNFAKIICDNTDGISAINRRVLQLSLIKVPCEILQRVNLNPWKPDFKCLKKPVYGDANDDNAEF